MTGTVILGSGVTPPNPTLMQRLRALAAKIGQNIWIISGTRTPAHSVAVGGFANDPHTRGQAADIGVGSQLRASAGQLTEAQLNSVGLTRPFAGAAEINHIQALPGYSGNASPDADSAALAGTTTDTKGTAQFDTTYLLTHPKALVGELVGETAAAGARLLLEVALIVGGALLALYGLVRAAGVQKPVHTLKKTAATAAMVAPK